MVNKKPLPGRHGLECICRATESCGGFGLLPRGEETSLHTTDSPVLSARILFLLPLILTDSQKQYFELRKMLSVFLVTKSAWPLFLPADPLCLPFVPFFPLTQASETSLPVCIDTPITNPALSRFQEHKKGTAVDELPSCGLMCISG